MKVEFTACEHLDFEPNYGKSNRQLIMCGETKLCWRRAINGDLVQFCKLRGRINNPVGCVNKENASCSEYNDVERSIDVSKKEIDS